MSSLASAPDAPTRLRSAVEIGFVVFGVLVAIGVAMLFLALTGASRTTRAPLPNHHGTPALSQPRPGAPRTATVIRQPIGADPPSTPASLARIGLRVSRGHRPDACSMPLGSSAALLPSSLARRPNIVGSHLPCARQAGRRRFARIAHAISYFHAIQQAPTDGNGTALVALARRSQRSKRSSLGHEGLGDGPDAAACRGVAAAGVALAAYQRLRRPVALRERRFPPP